MFYFCDSLSKWFIILLNFFKAFFSSFCQLSVLGAAAGEAAKERRMYFVPDTIVT